MASHYHDRSQSPSPTVKPEDLVTVLNLEEHPVELSQNEINVLSLGPGFAVTPKINDKMLHNVEVNLAQCAYSLKWNRTMEISTSTDNTLSAYSEIKKLCPNLQTPFISTPPTIGVDIDVQMKNLSDFVLDTIKNTNLRSNLSNSQRAGVFVDSDRIYIILFLIHSSYILTNILFLYKFLKNLYS